MLPRIASTSAARRLRAAGAVGRLGVVLDAELHQLRHVVAGDPAGQVSAMSMPEDTRRR